MYAVVDVETTGLFNRDRIAEIAIVHVGHDGEISGQWHSLINPGRDLGRADLHGIRAADARRAPRFEQLAGDIAARLAGRIPVMHNIGFDARMLQHEFDRIDYPAPYLAEYGVCTMAWAAQFLPGSRSLGDCCAAAGIVNDRPHEALSDALATAELLAVYLDACDEFPPWDGLQHTATDTTWPPLPAEQVAVVHRRPATQPLPPFVTRLPSRSAPAAAAQHARKYLSLLDHALIDRHISETEADALVATAMRFGIGREHAEQLHREYLTAMVAAPAQLLGKPDTATREDLDQVVQILGLPTSVADAALRSARKVPIPTTLAKRFSLCRGDTVVLTGTFPESKRHWQERCVHAGLNVAGYVSKQTRMVVAADPDSMSGKARKARDYGIPVVTSQALKRML